MCGVDTNLCSSSRPADPIRFIEKESSALDTRAGRLIVLQKGGAAPTRVGLVHSGSDGGQLQLVGEVQRGREIWVDQMPIGVDRVCGGMVTHPDLEPEK